jgi:DNA-binding beta-propeller fold protein YncE
LATNTNTDKLYAVDPHYDDGTVIVIDMRSGKMMATVEVSRTANDAAYDLAINQNTKMLYVTSNSGKIFVIDITKIVISFLNNTNKYPREL